MTLQPVYVLTGTEPLLQKIFIEDLRKKVFPEGSGGFNDDQLDAKQKSWEEIFDLANTFPMFAQKRMITVRGATDFKADDEEVWSKYLENPPEHTVLILQADKLDKRKKVTKLLEKSGYLHDMLPPKLATMPQWVEKIAEQKGLKVQPKAKMALVDAIGTNLTRLDKELDKLELFSYPEKQITDDAVSKLVLKSTGDNIFQFTDYIFEKRIKEALATLHYLLSDGTPGLVVLSMLVRHVRILTQVRDMLDQKQRPESQAGALGIPPFKISSYVSQARAFPLKKLSSFTQKLMQLDVEFKSTGFSAQMLLEKTILEFQK